LDGSDVIGGLIGPMVLTAAARQKSAHSRQRHRNICRGLGLDASPWEPISTEAPKELPKPFRAAEELFFGRRLVRGEREDKHGVPWRLKSGMEARAGNATSIVRSHIAQRFRNPWPPYRVDSETYGDAIDIPILVLRGEKKYALPLKRSSQVVAQAP